jgi:cytochrome c556
VKEKPAAFIEILTASENAADELRRLLQDSSPAPSARSASVGAAFRRVAENCTACHKKFRN